MLTLDFTFFASTTNCLCLSKKLCVSLDTSNVQYFEKAEKSHRKYTNQNVSHKQNRFAWAYIILHNICWAMLTKKQPKKHFQLPYGVSRTVKYWQNALWLLRQLYLNLLSPYITLSSVLQLFTYTTHKGEVNQCWDNPGFFLDTKYANLMGVQ